MSKEPTIQYAKRYFNNMGKMMELNYMEIYLLMYLTEVSDEECLVYTGKVARQKFIEFVFRVSKEKIVYKDNSVRNALQSLKLQQFIVSTGSNGSAWLNPKYFCNQNQVKRNNMIKFINKELIK